MRNKNPKLTKEEYEALKKQSQLSYQERIQNTIKKKGNERGKED